MTNPTRSERASSRRRFIKTSLAGSAGLMLPGFIPRMKNAGLSPQPGGK